MTDSRTVFIDKQEDRDMQLRDHRILAVFLIDKMGRSMSFFYRRMFIRAVWSPTESLLLICTVSRREKNFTDITMRIFCR